MLLQVDFYVSALRQISVMEAPSNTLRRRRLKKLEAPQQRRPKDTSAILIIT
jgi:hypothetical protein